MVLESLIPVKMAERKPIQMLPMGFLYATFGVFIALWIFPNHASLTLVFFTVMAVLPLMIRLISYEESKIFIRRFDNERFHIDAMPFFVYMFIGMVLAFTLWFVVLPHNLVGNLFNIQLITINQVNNYPTASGFTLSYFTGILFNNIKVLSFVLLFSFIYGAGAIFILTWNASVIAVAIGNTVRNLLSTYAAVAGMSATSAYFGAFSLGLLRYLIHGVPEITGYFIGGLAGGMISVAVIKYNFGESQFNKVLKDSFYLVLLAVGVLIASGIIESTVSPMIPV